jgi:hypothetical protein
MSANERPQNETGREYEEDAERRHVGNLSDEKQPVPLFLRGQNDGRQGDAQDEKDETAE